MNKLEILKGAAELTIASGVSVVIGNLVNATTPVDANKFQKVLAGIGGYALGGLLGDMAGERLVKQIDGMAERFGVIVKEAGGVIIVQEGHKQEESPEKDESSDEN